MPVQINRLPVACTLHFDVSIFTRSSAYSNPPVQDVTITYTLAPHLMTDEHIHKHSEIFGAGNWYPSQDGNHQMLCDIGLKLWHHYFKILEGNQKAFLSPVQFIARKKNDYPSVCVGSSGGSRFCGAWNLRIQNEVREYLFRARPKALEGARASERPWSLSFISFTVNPSLVGGSRKETVGSVGFWKSRGRILKTFI
jgi:hypothetical protein